VSERRAAVLSGPMTEHLRMQGHWRVMGGQPERIKPSGLRTAGNGKRRQSRSQAREEKASERKKPRSAREAVASGEIQRRQPQPSEGATPWSEAATDPRAGSAGGRNVHLRMEVERYRVEPITRGEGRVERQGRSLASQALKGETPGANLVERHQGG
jgi:hypothetical protein